MDVGEEGYKDIKTNVFTSESNHEASSISE